VRHVVLKVPNEDQAGAQVFVEQGSGLASCLLYLEDLQAIMARPDFPPPDDE
jgi:hypothetical protein